MHGMVSVNKNGHKRDHVESKVVQATSTADVCVKGNVEMGVVAIKVSAKSICFED